MGQTAGILIADDHNIFCEGLKKILNSQKEFHVLAVAKHGKEAVVKTSKFNPDVVLMDLEMPYMNGIEATRIIKEKKPQVKVIILSMYPREKYWIKVKNSGADGYILKDASISELKDEILSHLNEAYHHPSESVPDSSEFFLSDREKEILSLVGNGLTNQEIADVLFLSRHTVKNHLSNIFSKLGCSNRAEAVLVASKMFPAQFREMEEGGNYEVKEVRGLGAHARS